MNTDHTQALPAAEGPWRGSWFPPVLWLVGVAAMGAGLWFGVQAEGALKGAGLDAAGAALPPLLKAAPWVFAFGFPVGVVLCALAVRTPLGRAGAARWVWVGAALVLVAAPVLVPLLAGRAPSARFFGTGGVLIAVSAVLSFLVLGRLRPTLPAGLRGALDLLVWGLACFAAAAWNLCGSAAMPAQLLEPETVLRLGTLPFAIGQMKTVLAQLALGWVLVLLAVLTAARRAGAAGRE